MLTNTAIADTQDQIDEITSTAIAIDAAERQHHAALQDIARLVETAQISVDEAAGLEAETIARFVAQAHELELRGAEIVDAAVWADYEASAARQRAVAIAERRRHPRLRGLSPRARALRERQMCVVASGRVDAEILRWLRLDEDDEALEAVLAKGAQKARAIASDTLREVRHAMGVGPAA